MEISELVTQALKAFKLLSVHVSLNENQKVRVRDCDGRFRLWSGSLGAHRKGGRRSLEHRLRDASGLRSHVSTLLEELNQFLVQGK